MRTIKLFFIALISCTISGSADSQETWVLPDAAKSIVLDDFEDYAPRGMPTRWKYVDRRQKAIPATPAINSTDEYFIVLEEGSNKFVRAVTHGRAHRLILPNKDRYNWELDAMPVLEWSWRARVLPAGAREDNKNLNDTGGAVYVTFSRDLLGRPKSIKYSYSSTLPVGTVVDYGRLKVLVVSTGKDGLGSWKHVSRNVAADYRRLFGGEAPEEPFSIMIWSDSDSVKGHAEVDFDNFKLSGGR